MNHCTRCSSILKLTHLSNFLCTRIQALQKCNMIINIRLVLQGFKIYVCILYDSGVRCQYYQQLRVVSLQGKGGGTEGGSGNKICKPVGDRVVCLALFKIIAPSSARTTVCLPCNAYEYSVQSKSWVAQNQQTHFRRILRILNPLFSTQPLMKTILYKDFFVCSKLSMDKASEICVFSLQVTNIKVRSEALVDRDQFSSLI